MNRHRFHGDWNYTLHPHAAAPAPAPTTAPEHQQLADHVPNRDLLRDPELTGMPRERLDELTRMLAESQATQRERNRYTRRGALRRRAPGAGRHLKLSDADRVLATVLYLRRLCTQAVLGELFRVDRTVITTAIHDVRPLLEQHGYAVTPSTARFPAPADLLAFLTNNEKPSSKIKPAC